MISLSKAEFNVISFLIRNFSKRFTIRNIAVSLEISAAGAHAALKKLELGGIVKAEKLGTGLFYELSLDNKVAKHLAAAVLLEFYAVGKIDVSEIEKESKAALFDGKKLLAVTNSSDKVKDICYKKNIDAVCKTEEEFVSALKGKEKEVLLILEKGNVLFGEELIIEMIKKVK
ncbi:MAG: hypothetical protein KJ561_01360 [Nanoarchaeota archaeon]|nr:hypothetical protein [Nanoarchaeota archaeon]